MHDLALAARFTDRLVLMSEGAVVASGPPDAVLSKDALAAVYHISVVSGGESGGRWVIPWTRLPRGEEPDPPDAGAVERSRLDRAAR